MQFNDPYFRRSEPSGDAFSGGNPVLQPETSKQWSVGMVRIQPVAQFSFGMDWYNIKINDNISTPGAQEVVTLPTGILDDGERWR